MKKPASSNATSLYIDIGQTSLKAVEGADAMEYPLERSENGRLTDLCRERLTLTLRGFLSKNGGVQPRRAWCAIGARGVSLRRVSMPPADGAEFQRMLRLRIESEFPVSPDDLAWGWQTVGKPNGGPSGPRDVLIVAVRKDVIADYSAVLTACGVTPLFTLAAFARAALHPPPAGSCSVLDIGRTHSEWVLFENGTPVAIRMIAWGGETITRSLQQQLAITHDVAEIMKLSLDQTPDAGNGLAGSAVEAAIAQLAAGINPKSAGGKIYLTGRGARNPRLAAMLSARLGGLPCESPEPASAGAASAAILGLTKCAENPNTAPALPIIGVQQTAPAAGASRTAPWKWAVAAAALALAAIFFPDAEALLMRPRLEKKIASLEADRGRLATIDQELTFLQDLKDTQPPYLDTFYLLARSAPPGTRIDSIATGRRGDVAIRAKMGGGQQVTDFRAKLIDSGWFSSVSVEEQSPTPDRQVSVRMTAQLKPSESRKSLAVETPSTNSAPSAPQAGHPIK